VRGAGCGVCAFPVAGGAGDTERVNVFRTLGPVHGRGFNHSGELVPGTPALCIRAGIGVQLTTFTSLLAPVVQGLLQKSLPQQPLPELTGYEVGKVCPARPVCVRLNISLSTPARPSWRLF